MVGVCRISYIPQSNGFRMNHLEKKKEYTQYEDWSLAILQQLPAVVFPKILEYLAVVILSPASG